MRVAVKRTGPNNEGFFVDWFKGMRIADLRKGIVRERADANYMPACVARIYAGVIKSGECDFTYLIPEPQEGNVGSIEQPYHYDIEGKT